MSWLLALALLLPGCAMAAPSYYYCWNIQLRHKDGRRVDALECIPRERKVPWHDQGPGPGLDGRDLFS